ncbi:MAG: BNR-repeat neuraminidase N-terminal domain-containing protein, partial [Ignavibacteria bacterium]|nr:BNR-repeat neuraminidase N-terminal domain-containing protein [Ignavibacteria bacterium]
MKRITLLFVGITAVISLFAYGFNFQLGENSSGFSNISSSYASLPSFSPKSTVTESFDGTTFPPLGWFDSVLVGSTHFVRVTTGSNPTCSPHSGAGMSQFYSYSGSGNRAILVTPSIDLTSGQGQVSFWMYRDPAYATNYDSIGVWVNTSKGLTGAAWLGNVWRYSATANWYQFTYSIPAGFNGATNYIIFVATSTAGNNMYIDDVSYGVPTPMAYTSSTTTQVTGNVSRNSTNNAIIGIPVTMAGILSPINLTQLNFTTTGSTNPTTDIANAKVYFTGSSNSFATGTQFGSTVVSPNGSFSVTGTQTLADGINYFWLSYDLSGSAVLGNYIDATCQSITGSGTMGTVVPTITAPPGNRQISAWFTESFDNTTFPPIGWKDTAIVGTSYLWVRSTSGTNPTCSPHSGAGMAYYNSYSSGSGNNAILVTPPFDLTAGQGQTSFWFYRDPGFSTYYDSIAVWVNTSPGLTGATPLGNIGRYSATAGWYQFTYNIPSSFNGSTNYLIYKAVGWGGNNLFLDDVSYGVPPPMVYNSSTTSQTIGSVLPNSTNNQIIGMQVLTTGSGSPLNVTQLNLTTTGSSNPTGDIRNAKIFYTGLSNTFATTTQFGTTVTNPNGSFNISGTQALSEGLNYFWLSYDIPSGATLGNVVDATCEQIIGSGTMGTVIPVPTAPAGNKTIAGPFSGTFVIGAGQTAPNYPNFSIAISDLITRGINGPITFLVKPGIYGTDAGTEMDSVLYIGPINGSSATNTITFKKKSDEAGDVWVERRGTSGTTDYIIGLNGSQYTTFDSINVRQKDTASAYNMVEWGYYLTNYSATVGANNNTIRNCQIYLKNTNINTVGIRQYMNITPTMSSGTNSNNTFQNNTIVNSYYGFYLYGYVASTPYNFYDLNTQVTGNNLVNIGGATASAAYGIYTYYQGNGLKILNNVISTASYHANTFYGIYPYYGYNANIDINGNTLNANYNANYAFYGIYPYYAGAIGSGTVSNRVNMNNNTFNLKFGSSFSSSACYGIYPYYVYADTVNIRGNTFANDTIPGTGIFYGIYPYDFGNNLNISGNTFNNIYRASSGTVYPIYANTTYYNKSVARIYNNTISNIRSVSGSVYGIYSYQNTTCDAYIYNNNINNLFTGTGTLIYGIYNTYVANSYIYGNKINNLKDSAYSSGVVYGIYAAGTTNNYYYNNFISNLRTLTSSSNPATVGIYVSSGVFNGVYNNSIYMADTSSSASYGSAGIYLYNSYPFELKNNNIVNISKPGNSGYANKTAGIKLYGSSYLTNLLGTSNYNNIYCGSTSDTGRVIYFDGSNRDFTLASYKTRVSPREQSSVSELPPFVNAYGGDLHLSTGTATLLNNTAGTITSPINVNVDIDGTVRSTPYSDIGAAEFSGTSATDIIPPTITFTPLGNGTTSNRTLSNVTITDPSGVYSTAAIWYKKSTNANTFNDNTSATDGWKYATGTLSGNTVNLTIDYTKIYGGTVAAGDIIQYFVNAQDNASTPNVGINAGGYTTIPTSITLAAANFPIIGPINQYTILSGGLTNAVYVGTGQTYTSLTGAAPTGLFAAINSGVLTGDLNVVITSDLIEAGTNQLQNWSEQAAVPARYKIAIKPDGTTVRNIYGWVSNSNGMIRLYGVNNVTIDGSYNGSGRYLRIANRYVGSGYPTLQLYGGCTYDTVKNCVLEGNNSSTSSGILLIGTAYATNPIQPNNYLVISGNLVSSRSDSLVATANYNGITNYGSSAPYLNSYNQILNNEIKNCSTYPIYVSGTGSGDGWTIKGNSVYYLQDAYTPAYTGTTMYGIYVVPGVFGSNYTVDSNYVGGSQAQAGGSFMNIQGLYYGIYTTFGFNSQSSLRGNVVKNIRSKYITATTSTFYSMYCGSGWMNVSGNYVGSSDTAQRLEMNGAWRGIYVASSYFTGPATITCNNNTISNVWTRTDSTIATLTATFYRYGIVAGGSLPTEVSNNTIKNIFTWQSPGATSYNNFTMGILPNVYAPTNVRNNVIDSIGNFVTTAPTSTGRIICYGMQPIAMADGSVFSGNRISRIFSSTLSGSGDLVMGIYNAASYYGSTVTFANNQVSMLNNSGTYANVMGVIDVNGSYAGGVCNWYDNTILVGGSSGGLYNSYAYYKNTTVGVPCYTNMRNNILYNMRTGGGVNHAAIGTYAGTLLKAKEMYPMVFDDEKNKPVIKESNSPNGNSPLFTSDYNYFVAPGSNTIGDWYGTFGNMSNWQTGAGTDANSVWDTVAAVPAGTLFRNYGITNLNIDTTVYTSLKIYKKGIGITGINTDFNGYPRATSGPVNIGSHEFTFTKPVNVSLIYPSNNAVDLYMPFNMNWSKSVFALSYGIQISTDSTFASSLVNTAVSDSVYTFNSGSTNTKYYWRVWPIYTVGNGAYTSVWNFKTAPNSPNSPVLITPANNAINQPYTNLVFSWTKAVETMKLTGKNKSSKNDGNTDIKTVNPNGSITSPLAVSNYWFELTTDSTFASVTVRDSSITDTTKIVATLTSNVNYWWRVKAKNQTGWGSFSTIFKFRTTLDPTFLSQANFYSVSCPQVMAGGGAVSGSSVSRLPVMIRATVNSLVPYKLYRFYNGGAIYTDLGTSGYGAGNSLYVNPDSTNYRYTTSVSLTTLGGYNVFRADGSGSFTGWFCFVATGNATRFVAGKYVIPSVVLGDSLGTLISRLALNDSIKVVNISSNSIDTCATGIYGTTYGLPKNIVSIYDNTGGTGKPLTNTYLEDEGVTVASVVPFYNTYVNAQNGKFGAVIPNVNANGVRRVEQRDRISGNIISFNTDADGNWPGGANTINPTGGLTPLALLITDAPLFNAPVLVTPANGTLNLTTTPQMTWNSVPTAGSYRIQISTDSTFTVSALDSAGITGLTINVPSGKLTTNTKYYWRVNGTNIVGTSAWSPLWNFTTSPNAPNVPILYQPANGAVNQPTSITFKWYKAIETLITDKSGKKNNETEQADKKNAVTKTKETVPSDNPKIISKYWFELGTDSTFATVLLRDTSSIIDTTTSVSSLTNNTKYWWRVRAKNQTGWGSFSAGWNFTTVVAAPVSPTLLSPANGSTGISLTPLLDWNDVATATSYRVQITTGADSSTFTTPVWDSAGIAPSQVTVPAGKLSQNTKYYWRVNAANGGGTGAWAAKWNFTTLALNLTLNLKVYLEGFWDGTQQVQDTVMIYLASPTT